MPTLQPHCLHKIRITVLPQIHSRPLAGPATNHSAQCGTEKLCASGIWHLLKSPWRQHRTPFLPRHADNSGVELPSRRGSSFCLCPEQRLLHSSRYSSSKYRTIPDPANEIRIMKGKIFSESHQQHAALAQHPQLALINPYNIMDVYGRGHAGSQQQFWERSREILLPRHTLLYPFPSSEG